jgi:hypothetical protein
MGGRIGPAIYQAPSTPGYDFAMSAFLLAAFLAAAPRSALVEVSAPDARLAGALRAALERTAKDAGLEPRSLAGFDMALQANGFRILKELQGKTPPAAEYDEGLYQLLRPQYDACFEKAGQKPTIQFGVCTKEAEERLRADARAVLRPDFVLLGEVQAGGKLHLTFADAKGKPLAITELERSLDGLDATEVLDRTRAAALPLVRRALKAR